jgi:hypothetical protein
MDQGGTQLLAFIITFSAVMAIICSVPLLAIRLARKQASVALAVAASAACIWLMVGIAVFDWASTMPPSPAL